MKNKALIWTLVIAGIAVAAYVAFTIAKNNAAKNQLLVSQTGLSNAANWISSLFTKSQEVPTTELGYTDYSDPVFNRTDLAGLGNQ